jgi:hypothetical protein
MSWEMAATPAYHLANNREMRRPRDNPKFKAIGDGVRPYGSRIYDSDIQLERNSEYTACL